MFALYLTLANQLLHVGVQQGTKSPVAHTQRFESPQVLQRFGQILDVIGHEANLAQFTTKANLGRERAQRALGQVYGEQML